MGPQDQEQTPSRQSSTPTTALPEQTTPNQQGAGVDVLNQLMSMKQGINSQINQATKEAMVPISVAGPGTNPGLMLNPVKPYQNAPMINRSTVGARATRAKGISNIIIGAANMVGQYQTRQKQESQRVLAVDLERVMQSTQGIQEAKETIQNAQAQLQANPKDAQARAALVEAQKTLDKNTGIINSVLSDKKKQKQIAKALDINFTDPSANATEEHGALKQATASYAEQLQKAIPSNMQVNPQAMAKLQLLQDRAKSIDDLISKLGPPIIKGQSDITKEGMATETAKQITAAKILSDYTNTSLKATSDFNKAIQVAHINGDTRLEATNRLVAGRLAAVNALIQGRLNYLNKKSNLDTKSRQKILTGVISVEQKAKDSLQKEMLQNAKLFKNGLIGKDSYNKTQAALQSTIDGYDAQIKAQTTHISDLENLTGSGEGNNNGQQSTNSSTRKSSSVSLVGPKQDSDLFDDTQVNQLLNSLGTGPGEDNSEQ